MSFLFKCGNNIPIIDMSSNNSNSNNCVVPNQQNKYSIATKPIQTLKNSNTNIIRIFHLADIHINNSDESFSRHKTTFCNFINSISDKLSKTNPTRRQELEQATVEALSIINNNIQEAKQKIKPFSQASLTVICGDFLSNHNAYSDLCIKNMRSFSIAISKLTGLVVILGNHEKHLKSSAGKFRHCVDTLLANIPNVHLLVESGNYIYSNIIFNVFSLWDKKIPVLESDDHKDKISISLYHGDVNCINKLPDTPLKYKKLPLSIFGNSDYVLLGDAHTHSYLFNRKNVAYPGSLSQLHRKEAIFPKGYIVWDLVKKTSEHIHVYNPYAYVKFVFEKNVMKVKPEISEYNEVYCKCIDSDKKFCRKLIENYIVDEKKQNIVDVDIKNIVTDENEKKINLNSLVLTTNTPEEEFNRIIDEYNDSLFKSVDDEKFMNDVKALNFNLLANIQPHEINQGVSKKFKVCELYFSDAYTFGSWNYVNFDNMVGTTALIGENASGKSNFINILFWAIYGTEPGIEVANTHTKRKLCTFITIEQDGKKYMISRVREGIDGARSKDVLTYIKINTILSIYDEEQKKYVIMDLPVEKDIPVEKNAPANLKKKKVAQLSVEKKVSVRIEKAIINICGPPDNFKEIFTMMQDVHGTNFLELTTAKQTYEYFAKWANLGLLKELRKLNDVQINYLQGKLSEIDNQIKGDSDNYDIEIAENNQKIEQLNRRDIDKEIKETETEIEVLQKQYNRLLENRELLNLYPELDNLTLSEMHDFIDVKNNYLFQLESNVSDIHVKIATDQQNLANFIKNRKHIQEMINNHLNIIASNNATNDENVTDIKLQINNIEKIIYGYNEQINLISRGELFDFMINVGENIQNVGNLIKETETSEFKKIIKNINPQQLLAKLKKKILFKIKLEEKKLSELTKKLVMHNKENDGQENAIDKIIELYNQYENYVSDEVECHKMIYDSQNELNKKTKSIEVNTKHIQNYCLILESVENGPEIKSLLNAQKIRKNKLISERDNLHSKLSEYRNNIKNLESNKIIHVANVSARNQIKNDLLVHNYYDNMVQPNGLPKRILEKIILHVEKSLNKTLSIFTSKVVKIRIDDVDRKRTDDLALHIKIITQDINPTNMMKGSGFEKFIINFALRLAIAKTFHLSTPNFLILDEKLSLLDKKRVANLGKFFKFVHEKFQFTLIISHNPLVAEHFKNEIQIIPNALTGTSYILDNLKLGDTIQDKINELIKYHIECLNCKPKPELIKKKNLKEEYDEQAEKNKDNQIIDASNNTHDKKISKKIKCENPIKSTDVKNPFIYDCDEKSDLSHYSKDTNASHNSRQIVSKKRNIETNTNLLNLSSNENIPNEIELNHISTSEDDFDEDCKKFCEKTNSCSSENINNKSKQHSNSRNNKTKRTKKPYFVNTTLQHPQVIALKENFTLPYVLQPFDASLVTTEIKTMPRKGIKTYSLAQK